MAMGSVQPFGLSSGYLDGYEFGFWKHYIPTLGDMNTHLFCEPQTWLVSLEEQKGGFLAILNEF